MDDTLVQLPSLEVNMNNDALVQLPSLEVNMNTDVLGQLSSLYKSLFKVNMNNDVLVHQQSFDIDACQEGELVTTSEDRVLLQEKLPVCIAV